MIPDGPLPPVGAVNRVIVPEVVIRPIWFELAIVNHKLPSAPATISFGRLAPTGSGYSLVTTPAVVIRPMRLPPNSVNHSAPSGPAAIPLGDVSAVGTG